MSTALYAPVQKAENIRLSVAEIRVTSRRSERNIQHAHLGLQSMTMTKTVIFLAMALAVSATWAQNIYRCTINGARVIQDRPCPGIRLEVQKPVASSAAPVAGSSAETSPPVSDDMARSKAYLAQREKERRISDLQFQIGHVEAAIQADRQSRDRALAALAEKKRLANNNLAGAT